jgi:hypothetical protein
MGANRSILLNRKVAPAEIEIMFNELNMPSVFDDRWKQVNWDSWTADEQKWSTTMDVALIKGTELKLSYGYFSQEHQQKCQAEARRIVRYLNKKGLPCLVGRWNY